MLIVVEYSEANMGKVPPPTALFKDPSALTITQDPSVVPPNEELVVKVKYVKLLATCI